MTHVESRQRRKAMRQARQSGKTIDEIAQEFDVTHDRVRASCSGIHNEKKYVVSSVRQFVILADLLNTTLTLEEIGEKHSVSKQRIGQIYDLARQSGICFPLRGKSNHQKE